MDGRPVPRSKHERRPRLLPLPLPQRQSPLPSTFPRCREIAPMARTRTPSELRCVAPTASQVERQQALALDAEMGHTASHSIAPEHARTMAAFRAGCRTQGTTAVSGGHGQKPTDSTEVARWSVRSCRSLRLNSTSLELRVVRVSLRRRAYVSCSRAFVETCCSDYWSPSWRAQPYSGTYPRVACTSHPLLSISDLEKERPPRWDTSTE